MAQIADREILELVKSTGMEADLVETDDSGVIRCWSSYGIKFMISNPRHFPELWFYCFISNAGEAAIPFINEANNLLSMSEISIDDDGDLRFELDLRIQDSADLPKIASALQTFQEEVWRITGHEGLLPVQWDPNPQYVLYWVDGVFGKRIIMVSRIDYEMKESFAIWTQAEGGPAKGKLTDFKELFSSLDDAASFAASYFGVPFSAIMMKSWNHDQRY